MPYIDSDDFLDLFYAASIGQDKEFIKIVEMVINDIPTVDLEKLSGCKNCIHKQANLDQASILNVNGFLYNVIDAEEKIVPPLKDDGTIPNLPELPKSEIWYEGWDLVKYDIIKKSSFIKCRPITSDAKQYVEQYLSSISNLAETCIYGSSNHKYYDEFSKTDLYRTGLCFIKTTGTLDNKTKLIGLWPTCINEEGIIEFTFDHLTNSEQS